MPFLQPDLLPCVYHHLRNDSSNDMCFTKVLFQCSTVLSKCISIVERHGALDLRRNFSNGTYAILSYDNYSWIYIKLVLNYTHVTRFIHNLLLLNAAKKTKMGQILANMIIILHQFVFHCIGNYKVKVYIFLFSRHSIYLLCENVSMSIKLAKLNFYRSRNGSMHTFISITNSLAVSKFVEQKCCFYLAYNLY